MNSFTGRAKIELAFAFNIKHVLESMSFIPNMPVLSDSIREVEEGTEVITVENTEGFSCFRLDWK